MDTYLYTVHENCIILLNTVSLKAVSRYKIVASDICGVNGQGIRRIHNDLT